MKPLVSSNVREAYVLLCGSLLIPVGHNPDPKLFLFSGFAIPWVLEFSGTFAC